MHVAYTHMHAESPPAPLSLTVLDTAPALALRLARPSTPPGGAWASSTRGEPDGLPVLQHEGVVEVGQVAALLAPRFSLVQT